MSGDGCSVQPWCLTQQVFTGRLRQIRVTISALLQSPRPTVASYFTKVKVDGVYSEVSALKAGGKQWQ